jgi:hypothetical protein
MVIAAVGLLACVGASVEAAEHYPAPSPTIPPASRSEALQEVTVTAKRTGKLARKVSKFVNHITATENDGELPRWGSKVPVCPLVLGYRERESEFIRERISEVATAARVPLAGEHCRPNLFIVVTADPKKLLGGLSKVGRILMFGDVFTPCSDASNAGIDEFIVTPRAVRVWYNSNMTDDWGVPAMGCAVAAEPTRLSFAAVYDFSSVWVIADYTRLHEVSLGQLADYVAMVSLAKINPDAHLGDAPTILKLFDGAPKAAPTSMTDWDRGFLKSLYATEQRSKLQHDQIARDTAREIVH